MRVLYIGSGNSDFGLNQVIKAQGESLRGNLSDLTYYPIKGKGLLSYIKHIFLLRQFRRRQPFDLYHAHYSLSAFVASLAGCKPLVVSLMGSDVFEYRIFRIMIRIFAPLSWDRVIVKSEGMAQKLMPLKTTILPNGVDLELFKPLLTRNLTHPVNSDKEKMVLFISNPSRKEKNYKLAREAVSLIKDISVKLVEIHGISQSDLVEYYNSADALILTSDWEGSPNVVKEAMACQCPVVTTDVGDVRWVLGNTSKCHICKKEAEDVAEKLRLVLQQAGRTNGRKRIIDLQLDSVNTAERLFEIYNQLIQPDKNTHSDSPYALDE